MGDPDGNVVSLPISPEEGRRRIMVEAARQAYLSPGEWRLTVTVGDAAGLLQWEPETLQDIRMALDATGAIGKHQIELALRAAEAPLAQGIDRHRRRRNIARAGGALGRSDMAPGVGALPDVDLPSFEIDIAPAQAAQLRRAQTGEYRRDDKRPPTRRRLVNELADLRLGREVLAFLQPAGATSVFALELDPAGNVLRNQSLCLCERQRGLDVSENLAPHRQRSAGLSQLCVKLMDHRHREL